MALHTVVCRPNPTGPEGKQSAGRTSLGRRMSKRIPPPHKLSMSAARCFVTSAQSSMSTGGLRWVLRIQSSKRCSSIFMHCAIISLDGQEHWGGIFTRARSRTTLQAKANKHHTTNGTEFHLLFQKKLGNTRFQNDEMTYFTPETTFRLHKALWA